MAHGRVNSVGDGRLFRQYNTGTIPDMWQNAGNFKGVTAVDQTGNTGVATTVPQHPIPHHLLARSPHPRYNSPMTVQNPHDRFFRDSFGRPEIARNYLEEYLPANLLALLDLDTLILQEGTFIDESLREQQSDLLYQTRLKGDGRALFLYFLFEHKSQPELLIALQLLGYLPGIWQGQVKQKQPLSPIIPLVVYHGEKLWHVPTDFFSLLDAPAGVRPYLL